MYLTKLINLLDNNDPNSYRVTLNSRKIYQLHLPEFICYASVSAKIFGDTFGSQFLTTSLFIQNFIGVNYSSKSMLNL